MIGFSEDLPAGVAREWGSWGRHRDYLLRVPGRSSAYSALELPLFALSFSDDAYAPEASVTDMLSRFSNAPREHLHLEPEDVGVSEIGHFGFFRDSFRETLWPVVTDWLQLHG
jgi:predicted alpha/beta hydrolase